MIKFHVVTGRNTDALISPARINGMYRLRAEVFNLRLGWTLPLSDGLEVDGFDTGDAVYILALNSVSDEVIGCWRLIPTTEPNMLNTIFRELLPLSGVIESPKIWELSRFAIKKGVTQRHPQVASTITRRMFGAAGRLAERYEIDRYVTVLSPAMHRLLRHSGLTVPHIDNLNGHQRRTMGRTSCFIDLDRRFQEFVSDEELTV